MPVKLVSAGGGGVILQPASSIGSDVILETPVTPQRLIGNKTAGTVLQVVQTVKTDTFTSSAQNTWTDITGMTATITPSSASNRIMVDIHLFGVFWRMGGNGCIVRLLRNGSVVGGGDPLGNRSQGWTTAFAGNAGAAPDAAMTMGYKWIDSPNSTSALTYRMQFFQDTPANPIYLNRTVNDGDATLFPRGLSTITLTEIAA